MGVPNEASAGGPFTRVLSPLYYDAFDVIAGALVGVFYVVGAWWEFEWVSLLRAGALPTIQDAQNSALAVFAVQAAVYAPVVVLLAGALLFRSSGAIRASLTHPKWRPMALAALAGAAIGVLLDQSLLWPWIWRFSKSSSIALAQALWIGDQWLAIVLWLFVWALLVPLIEEIVFRGWLLQVVLRMSRFQAVGVTVSALAFGLLHIGPTVHPTGAGLRNAVFAILFSLIAGATVVRRAGHLDVAVALHWGHSLAGLLSLLAVSRPSTT